MLIDDNSIAVVSPDVIVRPDAQGILLFQVRTDEMHFVTPSAHLIWSLCDGNRTVGELLDEVTHDNDEQRMAVRALLDSLATRSLIEIWS